MYVNLPGILIAVCILPLFVMMGVEYKQRGPRPAHVSLKKAIASFLIWPAMAVITFFFASLPALHAQWKLASGRGLIYRVAETGSRSSDFLSRRHGQCPRTRTIRAIGGAVSS